MFSPARTARLAAFLLILAGLPAGAFELIEDHQDLEGPFQDGPSVTAACLDCHDDAAHDFMQTSHWTWAPVQDVIGKGRIPLGKKNIINNFCCGLTSNWPRCTSCHPGYNWTGPDFDFSNPENVDCLVCHDRSGTYRKFPTGAGHPVYEPKEWRGKIWEPIDLEGITRTVGMPSRRNCGVCHFYGGGGNNVKHGDLSEALLEPAREIDVHMSPEGLDLTCQDCHETRNHDIRGNSVVASPSGYNRFECTDCHEDDLHEQRILNWHGKTLACQTCHIPDFARVHPTLTYRDWSTAGQKLKVEQDEFGMDTFNNMFGSLQWGKNVVPTYTWYDGISGVYMMGDAMSPDEVSHMNWPQGHRLDPKSKIHPFKIIRGKQAYDRQNRIFVLPKLFGADGFWTTFDWAEAIELGMAAAGLEYSGEFGFAETMAWRKLNHMVPPKELALTCVACHPKEGEGRLDWVELGYRGDPARERGLARYELEDAYRDVNQ